MRTLLPTALAASLLLPATALAAAGTGGVAPGETPPKQTPTAPRQDGGQGSNGGAAYGGEPPAGTPTTKRRGARRPKPHRRKRRSDGRPLLELFQVSRSSLFAYGAPATVRFQIGDDSPTVRVRLLVLAPGQRSPLRTIDLGDRPTGATQTYSFDGRAGGVLPQGAFQLELSARDARGHRLRTTARASNVHDLSFHWHRFPLIGDFDYGRSADGRFGAPRPGHFHQGQDIPAPEGTPVVAPRGGRIEYVDYQAGGAGCYVVLDGAGEDRDYAFMHLRRGSVVVKPGQQVRTGQKLAEVGSTGESTGPHLHFEVWEGGHWWAGGKPVDPLPYLRRWDSWS
ncbi:MAG: peptidoglycan DD-metalloendopeptidase family protein [Thermoleophilaceae bacterium]|nr:peptidoglycan DD-metalloendopeptidase family protein [Thermoleophilaceae bacterium]